MWWNMIGETIALAFRSVADIGAEYNKKSLWVLEGLDVYSPKLDK